MNRPNNNRKEGGRKSRSRAGSSNSKARKRRRAAAAQEGDLPPGGAATAAAAAAPEAEAAGPAEAAAAENADPSMQSLGRLLDEIKASFEQQGLATNAIDVATAQNLLLALAGNVPLAAQYYWEHHFATASSHLEAAQQHVDQPPAEQAEENQQAEPEEAKPPAVQGEQNPGSEQVGDESMPVLRRSLENDFQMALEATGNRRSNRRNSETEESEGILDSNADAPEEPEPAQEYPILQNLGRVPESVSVSDDETSGMMSWKRACLGMTRKLLGVRSSEGNSDKRDSESSQADLSDPKDSGSSFLVDDWMDLAPGCRIPDKVLWGEEILVDAAGDDEMRYNDDNNPDDADAIPSTWRNASLRLSECGNGLILETPNRDLLEVGAWQPLPQGNRSYRSRPPPPYYCRALTTVLSILNALLYSGASIQGDRVECKSAKKPWGELSTAERKLCFEDRLIDALTALFRVAANVAITRRKKALAEMQEFHETLAPKNKSKSRQQIQQITQKLYLMPTCTWSENPSLHLDDEALAGTGKLQICSSLTHVDDLRQYVAGSLRSFLGRGGVALVLETIIRIHGVGVVKRMLAASSEESAGKESLIQCSCKQRQRKYYDENPIPFAQRNDIKPFLDTTPRQHDCAGVELVSLLCTGIVHKSWSGWSTGGLGFGILTTKPGETGFSLARPPCPVWILVSETNFSTLWLNESTLKDSNLKDISFIDTPGATLELKHWDCWCLLKVNLTSMRLVTRRSEWVAPKENSPSFANIETSSRKKRRLLEEQKWDLAREEYKHGLAGVETFETDEMESCLAHEDDKKYYPGNYRMWRYKLGAHSPWLHFHRLAPREQLLVDRTHGPTIKTIICNRYPGAEVDSFLPTGSIPLVEDRHE